MTFADYQAFRVAFLQLIEGDDLAGSSFSLDTADLMIGLGESRVYRDLRASTMQADLSAAVTANAATLPADLIELNEVYFAGERPLEILPLDRLRVLEADGTATTNTRYAAQDGDTLRFWPTATGTVIGSYYKRPAALSTAISPTAARYPECFLWAALAAAAGFLGFDEKEAKWDAFYQRSVAQANADERQRVYGGSPLRVRAR